MSKTMAEAKENARDYMAGALDGWAWLPCGAEVLFEGGWPVCMSDAGNFILSESDIEREASELTGETILAVGAWLKCRLSGEMVAEIDQHLLKPREEAA